MFLEVRGILHSNFQKNDGQLKDIALVRHHSGQFYKSLWVPETKKQES